MDKEPVLAFYVGSTAPEVNLRFWDSLVCFIDNSQYSHVEFAIPVEKGLPNEYDCYSSSCRDGGVRHKRMVLDNKHWVIRKTNADVEYALKIFNKYQGCKYDYLGLGSTKYYWFPNIPNRYFCSEIVGMMCGIEDSSNYGVKRLQDWAEVVDRNINAQEIFSYDLDFDR